jgi:Tol biopolymer transport system component
MSRLFISHSSQNNAEAAVLRDWLAAEGWDDIFLDFDRDQGIAPGERWEEALSLAANRCQAILFLVSRTWLDSEPCRREFNHGRRLNKRMFGVLIEDLAVADLPSELTDTWQLVNLAVGTDGRLFKAILPNGTQTHVTFSASGLARLKLGLTKAGLDARFFAWPPETEPGRPPYRGLKPLEAEDAGIFFGREAEVIGALDRLRGLNDSPPPRLLVILGASGAGKSSFLRAGLWPRLKRDDYNFLPLPVIRPERAALSGEAGRVRSLEDSFKAAGAPRTRADIRKAVEGGPDKLALLLTALAAKATPPALDAETTKAPTLVFAVDQGEEMFLAEGAEEAHGFLALLRDALASAAPACLALITIRSDAYERLQTAAALETIPQHTLSLPPLARGAYLEVIEGPARRLANTPRALNIDPALSSALLADIEAGGAKDALPLLAFTLERLYDEHGGDGSLTLADYEALGRVEGSIEAAVERALKASDANPAVPRDRAAKLALLRRGLIPWLAGVDPETNAPRRRVARLSEIPEEARPLIDHLVEARLLSTDTNQAGETTIEPSHEALLRQWGLLRGWLEEDLGALTTLEGVKRAADDWTANAKRPAWLSHRGGRLEEAERVAAREDLARILTSAERDYLALSRRIENDEARRSRFFNRLVRIAAVAIAIVAGLAIWQWREAVTQTERAEAAGAAAREAALVSLRFLTKEARQERDSGDTASGLLLAMAALPDQHSPQSAQRNRPYLYDAEVALEGARRLWRPFFIFTHGKSVVSAAFSPDGHRIVTASEDQTARVWDAETGKPVGEALRHEDGVRSAAFSPDGHRIVTASEDQTARVWDTETGKPVGEPLRHEDGVRCAAFSPDGRRIVTASTDKSARVWDAETDKPLGEPLRHEGTVLSAAFSPDGRRIVTASTDKSARVWDAETGKPLGGPLRHEEVVRSAVFSADSRRVVTASDDLTAQIWDAETGKPVGEPLRHERVVWSAAFSPDGRRIVTASEDDTARVWDAETGTPLGEPLHHQGIVASAAFSPDGRSIVTASAGTTQVWDVETGKPLGEPLRHERVVWSAAFSPDGRRIVTALDDESALVWDAQTRQPLGEPLRHEGPVFSAAFSPDGRRIVTASDDQTARHWEVFPSGQALVDEAKANHARLPYAAAAGALFLGAGAARLVHHGFRQRSRC